MRKNIYKYNNIYKYKNIKYSSKIYYASLSICNFLTLSSGICVI